MMRHGIEARQGRNRLLAGSVHESPAPKGDARPRQNYLSNRTWLAAPETISYELLPDSRIATKAKKVSVVVAKNFVFQFLR